MTEFRKKDGTTTPAFFIPLKDKETLMFLPTEKQSIIIDKDGMMIPCSTKAFEPKLGELSFKLDVETEDKIYHLNCSAIGDVIKILFPKLYR